MTDQAPQDISHTSESKISTVKWHDEHLEHAVDTSDTTSKRDNDSFLARQKRRISEHPKINKIQLARKTSKHNITFLRKALTIIVSSTIFRIVFFFFSLIPIGKIIMSLIFYNKCPVEPLIPIYLLVGGIMAVFRDCLGLVVRKCLNEDCLNENEVVLTLLAFMYTVTEFGWFIFGSYYVYAHYDDYPWDERKDADYCNNILYMFTFVVTTISYVLLIFVFSLSCFTMCLARFADTTGSRKDKSSDKSSPRHDSVG